MPVWFNFCDMSCNRRGAKADCAPYDTFVLITIVHVLTVIFSSS